MPDPADHRWNYFFQERQKGTKDSKKNQIKHTPPVVAVKSKMWESDRKKCAEKATQGEDFDTQTGGSRIYFLASVLMAATINLIR